MRYCENILEAIGNTPLIKLHRMTAGLEATVLVKFEGVNPGGSVKDQIGIAMIDDAEKKNILRSGGTVVEATAGNTDVGLAMVAAIRGYKMIFTMPEKMSREKERLLRAYGAEVMRTPTNVSSDDPRSNYRVAERLSHEIPDAFCSNQCSNESNPLPHYKTTGPEIWRDTDGKITHFVAGIGTGGTISGVGKFLREKSPRVRIVGADPEGSVYHHIF